MWVDVFSIVLSLLFAGLGLLIRRIEYSLLSALFIAPLSYYLGGGNGLLPKLGYLLPVLQVLTGISVQRRRIIPAITLSLLFFLYMGWVIMLGFTR